MSDEPDKTLTSSVPPPPEDELTRRLRLLQETSDMAVEYGKQANERLGGIERRLLRIERHVGLNGFLEVLPDTEPAPPTEPENARPSGG
jgi:hypothetical protein